jgi:hypothetical protein
MLTLADGTFSPLTAGAIPWGRASRPAGLAPEALQERGCSCKVFLHRICRLAWLKFQLASAIFQPATAELRTRFLRRLRSVHPRRCSRASSPRAWAHSRRSGRATVPRRPSAGRRVRSPQPTSSGSRIADYSLSCYRVVQVDAHAPFDKGRLMVRRLVHESACVGLLGRTRSRSVGTEGAEALPPWDPSTSCPRWLLNTICGAPSSW